MSYIEINTFYAEEIKVFCTDEIIVFLYRNKCILYKNKCFYTEEMNVSYTVEINVFCTINAF